MKALQTTGTSRESARADYLRDWARRIDGAAVAGKFGGKAIRITNTQGVNGPRAAALLLYAGFDAGALLRAMQADDLALTRQLIPFPFAGEPSAYMAERAIRIEAGWPSDLAESDIPLRALGSHPVGGGAWLVGRNERGDVPVGRLDDATPHWLVSGATGSGKSTALVSAVAQLARDTTNRLVLIDAKHGASLRAVANVRGRVGPLAADLETARAALAWAVHEMSERYNGGRDDRRLIVAVDEVQDIANDELAGESLRRLVVQGRGAHVHVIVATQHPVVASLGGPTVGRNLVGRFALRVADAEASRVACGGAQPRADHLLGRGDSYIIKPGVTHRCQVAWFDGEPLPGAPDMAEWPEADTALPNVAGCPIPAEVGAALVAITEGNRGRVAFQRAMAALGVPVNSNDKAVRLSGLAGGALAWLAERDYSVRPSGAEDTLDPDE